MTCEDCANRREEEREILDQILVSQTQSQAKLEWVVKTVEGLAKGFEDMMKAGGPLAMLKMLRSTK